MPPPFRLGPWLVEARRNRIRQGRLVVTLRPKTMELLVFFARQDGEVADIEAIHGALWAERYVTDSSVYNAIAQLREELGADAIETVPRRGYRLTLPVEWRIGQPAVRPRVAAGAAVLVVAAVIVAWLSVNNGRDAGVSKPPTLVLLPFNVLGEVDDTVLAWGIHNDLLTLLAGLGELRVIAGDTVNRLASSEEPVEAIRASLGDARIMRTDMQRDGARLRINAFMSDAATGDLLWAGQYERDVSAADLFTLQSDLAARIATEMRSALTAQQENRLATVPTKNFDAWEALVIGKRRSEERTVASLEAAVEYFRKAIALDPDYAEAHARLASTTFMLLDYGDRWRDTGLREIARVAAERAVELSPQLAEAHKSMGLVHILAERRAEAEAAFRRALELAPGDATLHHLYGRLLAGNGRFDDAIVHGLRAVMINPMSANIQNSLGITYAAVGRYDEAVARFQKALELDPSYLVAHSQLCNVYQTGLGRLDLAALSCLDMLEIDPNSVFAMVRMADIWHDLDDHAEAQRWGDRIYDAAPHRVSRQRLVYDDRARFIAEYDAWRDREVPLTSSAFQVADFLCDAGRHNDARRLLIHYYAEWYEAETPRITWRNDWDAIRIAFTLLHTVDTERGEALLEKVLDYQAGAQRTGLQGYGFLDILALHSLGREAEAIAAYEDLRRSKALYGFWRIREGLGPWREIAYATGFAEITVALEQDLAAQRRSLNAALAERQAANRKL